MQVIKAIDEINDCQARLIEMSSATSVGKRRGRKPRKTVVYYKCSVCEYTSERYYNVTRHEFRIHTTSAKKRQCCGKYFATKGDYYLHCEACHPLSRATSIISRTKYKILPDIAVVEPRESSAPSEDQSVRRVGPAAPYALRNQAGINAGSGKRFGKDDDDSEFTSELESSSEEESAEESSASSRYSSGYETKNTSLDINQNEVETKPSPTTSEGFEKSERSRCADEAPRPDQPPDSTSPTNSPTFDPGACETSSDSGERDEKMENFASDHTPSANPFDLPIKKRILRDITKRGSLSRVGSTVSYTDRLHRRATSETRREPRNLEKKIKNERDASYNDENVAPLSAITGREKCGSNEKVQLQVDPRISWHDFTRVHREYFDSLLRDRSFLDRFRHSE